MGWHFCLGRHVAHHLKIVARAIRLLLEVARDARSSQFLDAERREPVRGQNICHRDGHNFHGTMIHMARHPATRRLSEPPHILRFHSGLGSSLASVKSVEIPARACRNPRSVEIDPWYLDSVQ